MSSFACKECGEPAAIDNMDYLMNITGLDREELKYCSDHITTAIEGVTLDLSIGGAHTRSEKFQALRAQRKRDKRHGEEVQEAKNREAVVLTRVIYDERVGDHMTREYGESLVIEMPKLAKEDLKELGWQASHRRWDDERDVWLADADRVRMIQEHMESKGWRVVVDV